MHDVPGIRAKFEALRPYLDERRRRLWAAAEAMVLGRGGITAVANATGLERNTIRAGIRELQASPTASAEPEAEAAAAADRVRRVRAVGGGRKPLTDEDPTLVHDLEALVEPVTRGDPMSPLRWTCKSTRQLAAELVRQGHRVSHQTVADLLHALSLSGLSGIVSSALAGVIERVHQVVVAIQEIPRSSVCYRLASLVSVTPEVARVVGDSCCRTPVSPVGYATEWSGTCAA